MPKGVRLKPEQIVAKLREIEVKIGQGKDVLSACRDELLPVSWTPT